jgi:threonine dehydratase
MIVGYRCAVCGATLAVEHAFPWKCPRATSSDPYHVLHLVDDGRPSAEDDDPNPFVRYGPRLAWWAFARARGLSDDACAALTDELAGDFRVTPFGRSAALSDALDVELWVKDETGNVAGSHKARHLVSILLHLRAAEATGLLDSRPPLTIASCGNAAIAAATLAQRAGWALDVFVPTWMSDAVGNELRRLGATIHTCERRADDPPGDPAMLRFREAVAAGAIPFTVQGPENALCLDGGRTLGWEIADALPADDRSRAAFVQVGGGALAACVGAGLGPSVQLHTVQAAGCAPLAAAWDRAAALDHPERAWPEVMQAWPDPSSLADGILDDETYDWIADLTAMRSSGGSPIVAGEEEIADAHRLAVAAGFDVSATGSAGLAGVLAHRRQATVDDRRADDRDFLVIMSGVAR